MVCVWLAGAALASAALTGVALNGGTALVAASAAQSPGTRAAVARPSAGPVVVVAIVDGLRPDSITREDTPTLFRLRQEGVSYRSSHAAIPTVTRVNASTLATGTYPARHGLVSNTMFVPAVDPTTPFSTGEWGELLKLRDATSGRQLLFTKTLAEILQSRGVTFVASSSGSSGSAFLLNPRAPDGIGHLIHGRLVPGKRVAFPNALNDAILRRFGPAPPDDDEAAIEWTGRVLRELVWPDVRPRVLMAWLTEPDGAQHEHGVGSPEGRAALKNSDRHLGLMLDGLAASKELAGRVHVIVTSDHGFARHERAVNFTQALIGAGLKASPKSNDVVVVSNGQSVLLHVKGRDRQRIRALVGFLQGHEDVDVIFTRAAPGRKGGATASGARRTRVPGPIDGWVPGTFALDLAHAANEARGPDILFSLRWSSAANAFGVPGAQVVHGESREGPIEGQASGHGGLSPWAVRNTLILWGPSFARGMEPEAPAGTVDVTPTVLALLGIEAGVRFDGRVLSEAWAVSSAPGGAPGTGAQKTGARGMGTSARESVASVASAADASVTPWSETLTATQGPYSATIRVSGIGDRWYVDEGARVRAGAR